MPNIPFPDVPAYPGVPALVRSANVPPGIQVALGEIQTVLAAAFQSPQQWGIYDSDGNQLGGTAGADGLFNAIVSSIANLNPVLSTNAFEFARETKISDFILEQGGFASYNKVVLSANPVVTLALQGSAIQRQAFLNAIDAACQSTELYSIVTPEVTYFNYSMERYNMTRRAESGATLLILEITLKEIRQISAAFSTAVQTPITAPQNPAATPQTSSGIVQPQSPPTSVLKSIANLWPNIGNN